MQLVAKGQFEVYISVNPNISFFKYGYKRHTNFSMESIQLLFDTNPVLNNITAGFTYNCKITRYGDLLNYLYFCYTLPEVYSSDKYRFRWVKNIGTLLLKSANVTVDGSIIDTITGQWLCIWNELILPIKESYNNITGNIDALINPTIPKPIIRIRNNKFYTVLYPISEKGKTPPSIPSKNIILPLDFWFCRNPALALPLLQLQYSEIYINIQIEYSENLYQVYSPDLDLYISPAYFNQLYSDNITINSFINTSDLAPYIEANYIYLDTAERNKFLTNTVNNLLVEQIEITNDIPITSTANSSITIDLNIHKITKEIIWTLRRDDYYNFNENTNYTASIPEDNNFGILDRASIIWNRTNNRFEEKTADYFNKIQPYEYHSRIPKQGIYLYSFALEPEKWYPTGSYNAAVINTSLLIYVNGTYNNNNINNNLIKMNIKNKKPHNQNIYTFGYLANIYTRSYNIFSISSGTGGMKYVL